MTERTEEKRSARAVLAERILRTVNDGHLSSEKACLEYLEKKRSGRVDEKRLLTPLIAREHGHLTDFHGMDLITYDSRQDSSHTVLYLHGGAYTDEALPFHLNYCAKLAERIHAHVLLPLYPLTPEYTWRKTYELLTDLYRQLLTEKGNTITIMGDSAGGGLAIAFCQYLNTIQLPQPNLLIGLSPWVDIRMTNSGYEPYQPTDPMLDVPGLRLIGRIWAGELDTSDPKVSPLFGDCHCLPRTLLFTGKREILYPDIAAMYEKMVQAGVDAELIVGEGMNHVYPLYGLPESKAAIARIDQEIIYKGNMKSVYNLK